MKKKSQIRSKWASLPWKMVDVNQGSDHTEDDDDKFLNSKNHYDNDKANPDDLFDISGKKGGHKDDYVDGADDPGIFLGLEVIDGDKYTVEKLAVADGFVTKLVMKDDGSPDHQEVVNDQKSKPNDKPTNGKDQTKSKVSVTEVKNKYDGIDFSTLSRKEKNKIKLNKLKEKRKEKALERKRRRDEKDTDSNEENERKRNKKSKSQSKETEESSTEAKLSSLSQQEIDSIRNSWAMATSGLYLHSKLCASLYRMGFHSPTPIQASTLAASILGKRDIVGAAPTGSGKTLGYLLPILHTLMTEEDDMDENDNKTWPLTAMILCPTRELAMQVSNECNRLINLSQVGETKSNVKCETIVGGLSEQKQKRVLDIKKPALLVCTPGRLWDLLSSGDHEHLNELKCLRFLVIDEADRMVSQGNFPQLSKIFEKIQQANPSLSYLEANAVEDNEDSDDDDRLLGLPGVKGEAKVQMLNENILKMIEAQRSGKPLKDESDDESIEDDSGNDSDEDNNGPIPEPIEMDDEEYEAEQARIKKELEDSLIVSFDDEDEEEEPVKRQTFIFSATLSLPPSSHYNIKSQSKITKKGLKSVDGAIAEIMDKVGAQGQVKVVDLSTGAGDEKKSKNKKVKSTNDPSEQTITTKLPSGLSLYEIKCTQKHKDSHLYAYLTTTKQGASGTALVFCNSIGAVKRVAETLKTLGLPTRTLHAQMEQKGRIASIESLNGKNSRSVVVCTDVAARGLDIPNVASIVHYDVPRAIDTFIHRAGRTARGMGENAVGWSISLVSAAEEKNHQSICKAIRGAMTSSLDSAPMDSRLLTAAQERVNLASKIVACESSESRTNKKNQWFIDASKDAGVDLDEDLLEDGLSAGSQRERQQIAEAKQARLQLKLLLAKPMRKQNFGKFLSNVGLKDSIETEKLVRPHIVRQDDTDQKRKKKKPKR